MVGEDDEERLANLALDAPEIERGIRNQKIDLLVIDGTFGMLNVENEKSYTEAYIRMIPLVMLVRSTKIGAIAIRHVRKGDGNAVSRGIGSVGYASLGRSTISIVADRNDESGARRLFAHAKSNVGETGPTLAFTVKGVKIEGFARPVGSVEWKGIIDVTADEAMAVRSTEDSAERSASDEWLISYLATSMLASEVLDAGKRAGFSRATVYRSAKRLNIQMSGGASVGVPSTWSPPFPRLTSHETREIRETCETTQSRETLRRETRELDEEIVEP